MRVLCLLLGDRPLAPGTVDALARLGDDLDVVSWRPLPPGAPGRQLVLGGRARPQLTLGQKLTRRARLDPQRHRAWHELRRSAEAQELIAQAELLVAGDASSVLSAWRLARRRRHLLAVSSLGAGAVRLTAG